MTAMTGKLVRMDGSPVDVYDLDEERYYLLTRARNISLLHISQEIIRGYSRLVNLA